MAYIPDKAFILAAGQGRRLRPLTDTMPKPLVPVAGRPILHWTLDHLHKAGVRHVFINIHHRADQIVAAVEGYRGLDITFYPETELLDTGRGVYRALPDIGADPFFVINGDAFWHDDDESNALTRLANSFTPGSMDNLILLNPVINMELTQGVGDYDLLTDGRTHRRTDKEGAYMFAGIRICTPALFENAPQGPFSFMELMDRAEQAGRQYGLIHKGEWYHISTPGDLERVNTFLGGSAPIAQGGRDG